MYLRKLDGENQWREVRFSEISSSKIKTDWRWSYSVVQS